MEEAPSSGPADRAALYAALATAQGQFPPIPKNRSVTIQPKEGRAYHFRYADLEAIFAAVRPALAANGLALVQPIDTRSDGGGVMITMLTHSSGQSLVAETVLPKMGDRDPKQYGALITYMRRYMVSSMLGVAADDDLDENGQHGDLQAGTAEPPPAPRVARRAPAPQVGAPEAGPSPSAEPVGPGEIAFLRNKAKAVNKDLAELLAEAGGLVLEKLTRADFDGLKATLRKLEG